MELAIVLVGPEYEQNIGYCARIMANFGLSDLRIVNPEAQVGAEARKYSKHGWPVLVRARLFKTIKGSTGDCDLVIGTTGVLVGGQDVLRNPLTPSQLRGRISGMSGKAALLMGREGTGLSKSEMQECDFLVTIPASKQYNTLNISHALAILLYELSGSKGHRLIRNAGRKEKEALLSAFGMLVDENSKGMRNPKKVKLAFRRVMGRALISESEAATLMCAFSKRRGGKAQK